MRFTSRIEIIFFPDINQKKLTSTTLATRGRMRGCRKSECAHAHPQWNVPSLHGQHLPIPQLAMGSKRFQTLQILFGMKHSPECTIH